MDSYHTITRSVKGPVFKDKKSKFIGYAFPLNSAEEADAHLEFIRKNNPDASHVCYAWQVGHDGGQYRVNDDGEPHNSAGKPILGQIKGQKLTNILVAVIRYYGGKKLGVGGLIHAYKTAAKEVLSNATLEEREIRTIVQIFSTYAMVDKVLQISRRNNWDVITKEMGDRCKISLSVRPNEIQNLNEVLGYLEGVKIVDQTT